MLNLIIYKIFNFLDITTIPDFPEDEKINPIDIRQLIFWFGSMILICLVVIIILLILFIFKKNRDKGGNQK